MVAQQKAIRAFSVANSVDIYRVIGRRPSSVWVDDSRRIAEPGPQNQPLKELVYWHTKTKPGEEIQERIGGLFLVTVDGACHPIALCLPEPLEPGTAFVHAQAVRQKDAERITQLLAQGDIVEVPGKKPTYPASRPGDRLLPQDHALVVDEPPPGIDQWVAPPRHGMGSRRFGGT